MPFNPVENFGEPLKRVLLCSQYSPWFKEEKWWIYLELCNSCKCQRLIYLYEEQGTRTKACDPLVWSLEGTTVCDSWEDDTKYPSLSSLLYMIPLIIYRFGIVKPRAV